MEQLVAFVKSSLVTASRPTRYSIEPIMSRRDAEIIANNLKQIYPLPDLVTVVPTTTLAELRRTKAPAVLVEVAYHDNYFDAQWIKDNIELIASNFAVSTTEFLGVPFVNPYA